MKIRLEQIRTLVRSSPPEFPDENELYIDDGTNTASGLPGWRIYRNGKWEDIGLHDLVGSDITIDGGSF